VEGPAASPAGRSGSGLWKCVGSGLLERLAKLAGVAVHAGVLHHEDVSQPADRINPRLGAPGSSMTEGAR